MVAWNAQTGEELLSFEGTAAPISPALTFGPDGSRFASTRNEGPGGFGEVVVRDSQTGQELLTLKGHTATISSIDYSPDGKRLVSASGNPTSCNTEKVKVWDAESGLELLTIPGGSYGHRVAISPDGCWLASCVAGTLKIYDATPLPEKP
jgi:WD40 repeat protein